jgi:hypothetical protein
MVLMSPIRADRAEAARKLIALARPAQKKMAPTVAGCSPKRSSSHRANSDCTKKPLPKASMANSAVSRCTMPRDGPSDRCATAVVTDGFSSPA